MPSLAGQDRRQRFHRLCNLTASRWLRYHPPAFRISPLHSGSAPAFRISQGPGSLCIPGGFLQARPPGDPLLSRLAAHPHSPGDDSPWMAKRDGCERSKSNAPAPQMGRGLSLGDQRRNSTAFPGRDSAAGQTRTQWSSPSAKRESRREEQAGRRRLSSPAQES